MGLHYDLRIEHYLKPGISMADRQASHKGPIFNPRFEAWREHITGVLANDGRNSRYEQGEEAELYAKCKEHVREHSKKYLLANLVLLTHPLYLHLRHAHHLNQDTRRDADQYLDRLFSLLRRRDTRAGASVVLIDSVQQYAAATSLLLEQGLVDLVIFTESRSGQVLDLKDLSGFPGRKLYIGGAYAGLCLKTTIENILLENRDEDVRTIRELCLFSPVIHQDTLRPELTPSIPWDEKRELSLGSLAEKAGIEMRC
ncbi:hypothetical protein JW826_00700 [Candidatus Woesearchaeota archaeon]|nr:hypothetical protein [Candidatus Woesearchaeota archaeon]